MRHLYAKPAYNFVSIPFTQPTLPVYHRHMLISSRNMCNFCIFPSAKPRSNNSIVKSFCCAWQLFVVVCRSKGYKVEHEGPFLAFFVGTKTSLNKLWYHIVLSPQICTVQSHAFWRVNGFEMGVQMVVVKINRCNSHVKFYMSLPFYSVFTVRECMLMVCFFFPMQTRISPAIRGWGCPNRIPTWSTHSLWYHYNRLLSSYYIDGGTSIEHICAQKVSWHNQKT